MIITSDEERNLINDVQDDVTENVTDEMTTEPEVYRSVLVPCLGLLDIVDSLSQFSQLGSVQLTTLLRNPSGMDFCMRLSLSATSCRKHMLMPVC